MVHIGIESNPLRAPSNPPPFLSQKELYRARVHRRRIRPLPPQDPRTRHPFPTKPMIRLQPTNALAKHAVSKPETAMGRFDPENSERTVCLDYRPRDRVRIRRTGVGDEMAVADRDGGVSARFEVGFVS